MEIGFVNLIKGTETEDLKYLDDFLKDPKGCNVDDFRVLNPQSFVNLFDEYTFSKDNVLLSFETVYKEIKKLEKAKAKRDNPGILTNISQHFPSNLLNIPIQKGIRGVRGDMAAEEIDARWSKDRIYCGISIIPGFLLIAASVFYYDVANPDLYLKLNMVGSTYVLADMATYMSYLAGKEGTYRSLLTEKEADNLCNEIKGRKVVLGG
ncbi:hypothetical protein GQ472_03210 [archaeon]|nr:hypothetical protein [archaeon]